MGWARASYHGMGEGSGAHRAWHAPRFFDPGQAIARLDHVAARLPRGKMREPRRVSVLPRGSNLPGVEGEALCDRVAFLHQGRLDVEGRMEGCLLDKGAYTADR